MRIANFHSYECLVVLIHTWRWHSSHVFLLLLFVSLRVKWQVGNYEDALETEMHFGVVSHCYTHLPLKYIKIMSSKAAVLYVLATLYGLIYFSEQNRIINKQWIGSRTFQKRRKSISGCQGVFFTATQNYVESIYNSDL